MRLFAYISYSGPRHPHTLIRLALISSGVISPIFVRSRPSRTSDIAHPSCLPTRSGTTLQLPGESVHARTKGMEEFLEWQKRRALPGASALKLERVYSGRVRIWDWSSLVAPWMISRSEERRVGKECRA